MDPAFSPAHDSWEPVLTPILADVKDILRKISGDDVTPQKTEIFAALDMKLADVRCVIVGQDPYPTKGNAHGLAFSVATSSTPIPASLRNIFAELSNDLGIAIPNNGNLKSWRDAGVLLLNRVLTTKVGESNAHIGIGWEAITEHVCAHIGSMGVPAILWGKKAQELTSLFQFAVTSVHPSPLSAYRGFFGSKPFSRINDYLLASKMEPIDWSFR